MGWMRYNLLVTRDNKMTIQNIKSIVDTFKPFRNELLNEPKTSSCTSLKKYLCEFE